VTDLSAQATLTGRAILAGSEALAGRRRGLSSLLPFAGPAVIASVFRAPDRPGMRLS
jgi:hypothetical protein